MGVLEVSTSTALDLNAGAEKLRAEFEKRYSGDAIYNFNDPEKSDRGQNGFLRWSYRKRELPKFEHRYGYYECRCRLQRKPGWWSAFWLNSIDIGATLDPARSGVEKVEEGV